MRPRRAHLSTPDRTGRVRRAETVSATAWLIGHVADAGIGERQGPVREQLDRLSGREHEVAVAIGLGKSNAEIGRELYVSVATVKARVSRVLEKLELNNRVQIALLAHDAGEA